MKRKSLLFLLLFALLAPWTANAQTVTIGDGTSGQYGIPIDNYYNYSFTEMLYTASDIAAGNPTVNTITSIAFDSQNGANGYTYGITVYMKNVDDSELSSFIAVSATDAVFDGTVSPTTGWVSIDLDAAFTYDNTKNLLIAVNKTSGGYAGSSYLWNYTTTTGNTVLLAHNDGSAYNPTSTLPSVASTYSWAKTQRPNVKLVFAAPSSCGKPTALAATANGQSATLTWSSDATQFAVAHSTNPDADPSDNVVTTVSSPTYTMNNLALDEDHYFWVRANCSATEQSAWTNPVSVHIGYCVPAPASVDNDGITNVTFGTGSNIVNNDTPKATYTDYSTLSGDVQAGVESTIAITFNTHYTYNTYVWVDLDNSLSFDADEVICYGESESSYPTTLTLTFTINPNQPVGSYLMRIGSADSGLGSDPTAADPCYTGYYACFQDYTLNVLAAPNCLIPTGLALTTDGETVTATWSGTASTYNIDINGTVTPNVTSPYTFNCALSTTYTVKVQANCGSEPSDWSNPQSITTPDCLSGRVIEYTLVDSYGDGWNGNAINVVDECGNLINTLTLESGSSISGTLEFCEGYYEFVFLEGSYKGETSWTFTEGGVTLFEGDGESTISGDILYALGDPTKPTDIRIAPETNRAEVSWTENGTATAWQICLDGNEANPIAANTNPFTLTGLLPGCFYGVKVRSVTGSNTYTCWSSDYAFVTLESCEAPSAPSIADSTITPFSANVAWTPAKGDFEFRYREVAPQDNYFEDGTLGDWTTIDADGDGNEWYAIGEGTIPGYNASLGHVTSASYNSSGALTPDNYLVSPQVSLGGSIGFWACNQDAYAETIGVAVSTASNDDPDDFTTIKTITLPVSRGGAYTTDTRSGNRAQCPWFYIYVDLSAYAGQTGYVAIRHYNCTDKFRVNVDNIVIEQPGDDSWTVVEDPISPVVLTDLTPNTDYEVQVRTACESNDYSRWMSNVFTTTSNCDAPTDLAATALVDEATLTWADAGQEAYNLRYRLAGAGWDQIGTDKTATGNWTQYSFDLSAYAGQQGYVALRHYNCTDKYWLLVDDVVYGGNTYNFDDGELPTDWTLYDYDGDGNEWLVYDLTFGADSTYAYSGNYGLISQSYINNESGSGGTALTPDNWVILPYGALDGTLTFYAKGLDPNYAAEVFGVYVLAADEIVFENNNEWIEILGGRIEDTTFVLNRLDAITTYEWQVQGVNSTCTDGVTEWSEISTFTTHDYCDDPDIESFEFETLEATTATLTWVGYQDSYNVTYKINDEFFFDDFSSSSLANWTYDNLASTTVYQVSSNGLQGYVFWYDEAYIPQTLISDEMNPVPAGTQLSFYYAAASACSIKVGYSSTDNDLESFTWSEPFEIEASNYFAEYLEEVPEGTKYFAVQYLTGEENGYLIVTYFDVTIEIENNDWVDMTVDESTATLEPLLPNTEYVVYVQGICGEGDDDVTGWVGGTFQTPAYGQRQDLAAGWNWFSTYIEVEDPEDMLLMLEEALGENGLVIRSKNDGYTEYDDEEWFGSLDFSGAGINNDEMYLVQTANACEIEILGSPADPDGHEITINPGWNWIGFPSDKELEINEALADFPAEEEDMLRSNSQGYTEFDGEEWFGTLENLEPGQGYMYYSNSDEVKYLIYDAGAKAKHAGASLMMKPMRKAQKLGEKSINGNMQKIQRLQSRNNNGRYDNRKKQF